MAPFIDLALSAILLSLASTGFAAPIRNVTEACGQVAALQNPDETGEPFLVPADIAYKCLESVPFGKEYALGFLEGLPLFLKWQSDIDILKRPPQSYPFPGVDLDGRLKEIRQKAESGGYKSELSWQLDVHRLLQSAHDGHLYFSFDLLSTFNFVRSSFGSIVSLSDDGKSPPKIWSMSDLKRNTSISAIKTIDGVDAVTWLKGQSLNGLSQDLDALYNSMFYGLPQNRNSSMGGFMGYRTVYTGPMVNIGFENGTQKTYGNFASAKGNWLSVKDGQTFYTQFIHGSTSSPLGLSASPSQVNKPDHHRQTDPWNIPSQPDTTLLIAKAISECPEDSKASYNGLKPIIETPQGHTAGFFLKGKYNNTAVLAVRSFLCHDENPRGCNEAMGKFLLECRKAKKEKLIIDLSSNDGGFIFLGFSLYKQILPNAPVDVPMNIRVQEEYNVTGLTVNSLLKANASVVEDQRNRIWDIHSYTNVDSKAFKSFAQYLGPEHSRSPFNFTLPAFWNFNNIESSMKAGGLIIPGYGNQTLPPQSFLPENIIIVTDGLCGSTCAVFTDLMRRRGIQTIAVGGRPQSGPMQAVGGVKGAQVLSFNSLFKAIRIIWSRYLTIEQRKALEGSSFGRFVGTGDAVLSRLSDIRLGAINFRNSIWSSDPTRTPRQFVYEPADCKIWMTRKTLTDVNGWWSSISSDWWGKRELCVEGSRTSSYPRPPSRG